MSWCVSARAMLREIFPETDSCLILNDRVLLAAGYEGVHVGQEDFSPVEARALLGAEVLIGLSTHGERQLILAAESPVDYLAIGPVFATQSKQVPDAVVGLDGVRAARGAYREATGCDRRHNPCQLCDGHGCRRRLSSGDIGPDPA